MCAILFAQQLCWLVPCRAQSSEPWPEADRLFHSDPLWLGGDGAFSIDLGKGRVLWLFGDSFIASKPGDKRIACRMVRNSLAIEQGYDPSKASIQFFWHKQNGDARSFFPERKDKWLWPMHGLRLGTQLLLFYGVIGPEHSPGSLGFRGEGMTAFLVNNAGDPPDKWQYRELNVPENNWKITLGISALELGGYVYLFGCDEPKHDVYLARTSTSLASVGDLSKIEWWSGAKREWIAQSEKPLKPAPLFGDGSTEFSVHWDPAKQRYVEVQSHGFGASDISMRWSKEITGPWSPLQEIYMPPESSDREPFVYAGKAHPELLGADLIATYATNGSDKRLAEDMSIYFPRFVRVTLGK
jgi:hypothetical protein